MAAKLPALEPAPQRGDATAKRSASEPVLGEAAGGAGHPHKPGAVSYPLYLPEPARKVQQPHTAEFAALADDAMCVTVEHCWDCARHQTTTKHVEEKYRRVAARVKEYITKNFPDVEVRVAASRDRRIGALEVLAGWRANRRTLIKPLWSKLKEGRWPPKSVVLNRLREIVPQFTVGITIRIDGDQVEGYHLRGDDKAVTVGLFFMGGKVADLKLDRTGHTTTSLSVGEYTVEFAGSRKLRPATTTFVVSTEERSFWLLVPLRRRVVVHVRDVADAFPVSNATVQLLERGKREVNAARRKMHTDTSGNALLNFEEVDVQAKIVVTCPPQFVTAEVELPHDDFVGFKRVDVDIESKKLLVYVKNATSKDRLPDAVVRVQREGDDRDAGLLGQGKTDAEDGLAEFGDRTWDWTTRMCLDVYLRGYVSALVPLLPHAEGEHAIAMVALSEVLPANKVRLVLTWGAQPADMDLHVATPDGGKVDFQSKSSLARAAGTVESLAEVETDDRDGYGPETLLLTAPAGRPGWFRVYARRYSDDGRLTHSHARVTMLTDTGVIGFVDVPRYAVLAYKEPRVGDVQTGLPPRAREAEAPAPHAAGAGGPQPRSRSGSKGSAGGKASEVDTVAAGGGGSAAASAVVWDVCAINGETGQLQLINVLREESPSAADENLSAMLAVRSFVDARRKQGYSIAKMFALDESAGDGSAEGVVELSMTRMKFARILKENGVELAPQELDFVCRMLDTGGDGRCCANEIDRVFRDNRVQAGKGVIKQRPKNVIKA